MASNAVVHNGKVYSLLTHVPPDSTLLYCQEVFLPVEDGFQIAPDDEDSRTVIGGHKWGTQMVVLANGNAYFTLNLGSPGSLWGSGQLLQDGPNFFKPLNCHLQILQV